MTAPPPVTDAPAESGRGAWQAVWHLAVLLLVAVAAHGWVIANTAVTARDSIGFARYAFALDSGRPWAEILREEAHPPGYPLAMLAGHKLVLATSPAPLSEQDEILLASQVASSVAGVLLVFPVYWLGRRLFDSSAGFWASLLLQSLPVFARDTADGLSDGPFLLCAVSAIAAGVWALDRPRIWPGLLACGLLSGLAYLVRPEGVLVPLATGAVLVLRCSRIGVGRALGGMVVVAIGFLLVGGPYMAVIKGFTNKPAFKEGQPADDQAAVGGPLFAEALPKHTAGAERAMWAAAITGKEWLKAGHYGVAVFAALGFVMSVGRVWREPKFWLPVLYAAGQLAVVVALGYRKEYVSERHLLPVAAVGVLFAAGGLPGWFRLWAKLGPVFAWNWWPAVIGLVLVVVGMVPVLNTRLHDDRVGHKWAGPKLSEDIAKLSPEQEKGVVVLDHYQWCQFFSGRATKAIQPDPKVEDQRVVFVVLEGKEKDVNGITVWTPEDPGFDSERRKLAVDYYLKSPSGSKVEWVYHWPEHQPKMVLAKITLPPK